MKQRRPTLRIRQGYCDPWWYVIDTTTGTWISGPFELRSEAEERAQSLGGYHQ